MRQSISFIIFVHPIFLLVEKFARVHHRSMLLRILVRIPVVVLVWFVALAIPFFGPINSVMGAFLLTVVVYMLPLATFMYAYRTKAARQVLLQFFGFLFMRLLFYWFQCTHHQIICKAFFTLQRSLIPWVSSSLNLLAIQVLGSNNISAFQIRMYTNEWKFMFFLVPITTYISTYNTKRVLSFH
jgi:hypothetical protein